MRKMEVTKAQMMGMCRDGKVSRAAKMKFSLCRAVMNEGVVCTVNTGASLLKWGLVETETDQFALWMETEQPFREGQNMRRRSTPESMKVCRKTKIDCGCALRTDAHIKCHACRAAPTKAAVGKRAHRYNDAEGTAFQGTAVGGITEWEVQDVGRM